MSNLSLERLLFDSANPADGPSIGTFIMGTDGNVIDSTLVGSVEGLNVNVLNGISVDLNGIYDVSTNATPDNMGLIGFTRAAAPTIAEQVEPVTVGAASADDVVAANVHGLDVNSFLMGYDGSTWDRLKATSGNLNVGGNVADDAGDSGNPVLMGSHAVSGASVWGTVTAADRAWLQSDLYRRILINDAPNVAIKAAEVVVEDEAIALGATPLAGRMRLQIQNLGTTPIAIGASGVTYAAGFLIGKGATESIEIGEGVVVYGISDTGKSNAVRLLELA